jgi:uncharacterized repeat protein (TIGR04138 family)
MDERSVWLRMKPIRLSHDPCHRPMSATQKAAPARPRYHPNAYHFLSAALRRTQRELGRPEASGPDDERAHITGQELLGGIRELALEQFGLMALTVFRCWGISATEDFGKMVFELIEQGQMRKSSNDHIADFYDVYDFREALEEQYEIDVSQVF